MAGASKRDHTNRLIEATSPYLLQHAHNPVDWYPWGEEALARAREERQADPALDRLLGLPLVPRDGARVLRGRGHRRADERALRQHQGRSRGAPGPRRDLHGGDGGHEPGSGRLADDGVPDARAGALLRGHLLPAHGSLGPAGLHDAAGTDRRALAATSARSCGSKAPGSSSTCARAASPAPGLAVGDDELRRPRQHSSPRPSTPRWGGFGGAPKFPPVHGALAAAPAATRRLGDEQALPMVRKTLDAMARGGMYDQVGGGFCRYSVDERWLVPHFEKMLYDNALLAEVYLEGHQATGEAFVRADRPRDPRLRPARDDLARGRLLLGDGRRHRGRGGQVLRLDAGADHGGARRTQDARLFCAYYDISDGGNWEGKSIPNTPDSLDSVAERLGLSPAAAGGLARGGAFPRLRGATEAGGPGPRRQDPDSLERSDDRRPRRGLPGAWDERYLAASRRAADFVLATLRRPDGGLLRTYRAGRAHLDAYLEDYAYLAEALIDLYEAGGDERYLREAETLADQIGEDFSAPGGGFYSTAERTRDGSSCGIARVTMEPRRTPTPLRPVPWHGSPITSAVKRFASRRWLRFAPTGRRSPASRGRSRRPCWPWTCCSRDPSSWR